METPQYLVPGLAIRPFQPLRRLGVAENLLGLRIPSDLLSGAQRDIGEMARGSDLVPLLDPGDGPFARFDTIQKIARVQIELLLRRARHLVGLDPGLGWRARMLGPARRMPGEHGNGVRRIDFHVRMRLETAAIDAHRALRAEKLQDAFSAMPEGSLAIRENRGEPRVFEQRVLCVRGLAVVLERTRAATR